MTIAELIEKLKTLPQNATVLIHDDGDGGYGSITDKPILCWSDKAQKLVMVSFGEYSDEITDWKVIK